MIGKFAGMVVAAFGGFAAMDGCLCGLPKLKARTIRS